MTYWLVNGAAPPIIDEFGQDPGEPPASGHNDDCGPTAEENGFAALDKRRPTYTNMHAIRNRDIAHGWFTPGSGNTIANINSDVTQLAKRSTVFYNYHEWYGAQDIINICEKCPRSSIVVGICLAYLLPHNEAGVHCHYVVIVGYDSVAGKVLIGNGDREPHGGPDWVLISDLAKCQVYGFCAVLGGAMALDIGQTMGFFTQNADGSWHCKATNHNIGGGMLDYYRTLPSTGSLAGLTELGLPLTDEIAVGKPKAGTTRQPTYQIFERGVLLYDPDRVVDNPPGVPTGQSVVQWHIDSGQVGAILFPPKPTPPTPPTPAVDVTAEFNAALTDANKVVADLGALKGKLGSQVK